MTELTDNQAEVLAEIAKHPDFSHSEIAQSLDRTIDSVNSVSGTLRQKGLILSSQGNGHIKDYREAEVVEEPEDWKWVLLPEGRRKLKEFQKRKMQEAISLGEAVNDSKVYMPPKADSKELDDLEV